MAGNSLSDKLYQAAIRRANNFTDMLGFKRARIIPTMKRPFRKDMLKSVPDDWSIGPPDFVGIASYKAASTWCYRILMQHPGTRLNRMNGKELCYFQHFGFRTLSPEDIDTYCSAFAAPDGAICGEWTPGYLHYPYAMDHLARAAPNTKLLAVVRNPVDRFQSAINQILSVRAPYFRLTKGERAYVFKTYSAHQEAIWHSRLYEPFRRALNLFDRSQLLLIQYEQLRNDPAAEARRIYAFLGLDEAFVPKSLNATVNQIPYVVPDLADEERRGLSLYFQDDVHAFSNLFSEFDLSLWPDFADATRST